MAIKPPLKTKSFSLASNVDAPLMRYVPVGFMKHEPTIKQFGSKPKLVFFGMKRYRPCYSDLENIMGDDLIDIYDVWDDDSFEKFLSRDYVGIFLNLHKGCARGFREIAKNPVSPRLPKLAPVRL